MDSLLRAGLAHLWLITIHPFEDGNGRVARAVADHALAYSDSSSLRFYSLSSQIQKERADYYDRLEATQKGELDVTDWLAWFLGCLARALGGTDATASRVLRKADFWRDHGGLPLSGRQKAMLNRCLDGFEGKLTAAKWAALTKVSIPTAQRDINDLLERGLLRRNPGGSKNTSYELVRSS